MKNFIIILSVFLMTNLAVNGQEIIKAKSTASTPVKPITYSNPSGIDNYIIGDSSLMIRLYCGPTQSEAIKSLFLIKAGEQYFKSDTAELKKYFKMNFIQSIEVIKKEDDLKKFGSLAKNGVILINVEKDKVNDVLNFSKTMKYELIK